jgi:3-hydroxybutyrate dehydrogenase
MSSHVALITGATSGIGLAIAKELAKQQINLIINGFGDSRKIADICHMLQDLGALCLHYDCNLSRPAQIKQMVDAGVARFGKIDILINNAGIQHVASVDDFPENKWEEIIGINLSAAFYTTKLCAPSMKAAKWGRIINIASAHGLVASPFKSAYVASKHGLVGFTKSVALELAEFGITANSICPGYVDTDLVRNQIADTAKVRGIPQSDVLNEVILRPHAIKKLIPAKEIASLANFLISDVASSITGASLSIDCGWSVS